MSESQCFYLKQAHPLENTVNRNQMLTWEYMHTLPYVDTALLPYSNMVLDSKLLTD